MWAEEVVNACTAFVEKYGRHTILITKILRAYDGIVLYLETGEEYKYLYETGNIIELNSDRTAWRKSYAL